MNFNKIVRLKCNKKVSKKAIPDTIIIKLNLHNEQCNKFHEYFEWNYTNALPCCEADKVSAAFALKYLLEKYDIVNVNNKACVKKRQKLNKKSKN